MQNKDILIIMTIMMSVKSLLNMSAPKQITSKILYILLLCGSVKSLLSISLPKQNYKGETDQGHIDDYDHHVKCEIVVEHVSAQTKYKQDTISSTSLGISEIVVENNIRPDNYKQDIEQGHIDDDDNHVECEIIVEHDITETKLQARYRLKTY